jgi:hypothetical protein
MRAVKATNLVALLLSAIAMGISFPSNAMVLLAIVGVSRMKVSRTLKPKFRRVLASPALLPVCPLSQSVMIARQVVWKQDLELIAGMIAHSVRCARRNQTPLLLEAKFLGLVKKKHRPM